MLNKHNLSIAKLASTDEQRKALTGVLVTPDYTVATDGAVLAKVTTAKLDVDSAPVIPGFSGATTDFKPFILDSGTALRVSKALPKKSPIPILNFAYIGQETNGNGSAEIAVTDLEAPQVFRPTKIEQSFPDWERAIPDEQHCTGSITLNAGTLISLLQEAKALANPRSQMVKLSVYSKPNPPREDHRGEKVEQPDTKIVRIDSRSESEPEQAFMGLLCELRF